ncbi:MAG: type II toxin-antitoxin system VapC family toxin [candidate division KSB1 bacterium]|nr:type II toxin-antitoxin system VapC family toxin [candidate division KSB1 bacterium]MDZ7304960.1 type II toxin-antitoxin system VapC family toxin [candidate division KSB1 bacterium]MDZ7314007.1 type II toxin-antitoxin system VapC family toxin [candidate division KSB1 bacterium]
MLFFYFDASALAKRYVKEKGSEIISRIFSAVEVMRMHALMIGLAVVVSIFVRKKNGGIISPALFRSSLALFRQEILENLHFKKFDVESILISRAIPLIEKHSINATDAVVLRSALDIKEFESERGNELVLVTSDMRLETAAKAEGLRIINPETIQLNEIETLLALPESSTP